MIAMKSQIDSFSAPLSQSPARSDLAAEAVGGLNLFSSDVPPGIDAQLDALPVELLPNFRLEGPLERVTGWLRLLARTPGLPAAIGWVIDDCARQAVRFVDVSGSAEIAIKLERICDDACRRLHHDYVAHRLVCTYRGPGTEWLPPHHEAALGDARDVVPQAWLVPVPRFAAALFAGRLLPGAKPILHRSPPIAGTGQVRLVLTINEPFSDRH
jgi:hypothetical protein